MNRATRASTVLVALLGLTCAREEAVDIDPRPGGWVIAATGDTGAASEDEDPEELADTTEEGPETKEEGAETAQERAAASEERAEAAARRAEEAVRRAEQAPDHVEGTVRQVGNMPFQRTVVESDGETVTVVGPLQSELTRLVGARVRVAGEARGRGPFGQEMEVAAYEVLAVDGESPYVGRLLRDGQGYAVETAGGGTLRLGVVPARFSELVGGRVWVTVDEQATVLRYGILRPPEEMPGGARQKETPGRTDQWEIRPDTSGT